MNDTLNAPVNATLFHWITFNLFIFILLARELCKSFYHPHPITIKEAIRSSVGWIVLALGFNLWLFWSFGQQPALEFLTGYLLEKSLSIDNLFVFLLLFAHFRITGAAQAAALSYGILGAIVLRGLLIWMGISLIRHFHFIFVLFGLFLMASGLRLGLNHQKEENLEESWLYRLLNRFFSFTKHTQGPLFFIKEGTKWRATSLLAATIFIELTDLVFALDSIPAILGITSDPFIVYSSNIFAILGLRSLFFALQGLIQSFHLLHYGLSFILMFIGVKMVLHDFMTIPTSLTLAILLLSITTSIILSIKTRNKK